MTLSAKEQRRSLSQRALEERQERLRYAAMHREAERQDEQWRQTWRKYRRELVQLPPEEIAQRVGLKCQFCGSLLIPRIIEQEVIGVVRPVLIWPDGCGCERGRMAIERTKRLKEREADKIQRDLYEAHLNKAGLIGWLRQATFDSYSIRHDWPKSDQLRQKVIAYVDMLFSGKRERNNWLIMYGNVGTGKSHLAAAVIHEAIDRGYRDCYFRVWPEYLKRLQGTWDKDEDGNRISQETEADVIRELQQGLIVVIDDLDKRQPSEWVKSTLYSVLNYRYNAEMPTILTFNCGPGEMSDKAPGRLALEEYLGRAVLDRIIEVSWKMLDFDGLSHRAPELWQINS